MKYTPRRYAQFLNYLSNKYIENENDPRIQMLSVIYKKSPKCILKHIDEVNKTI